MYFSTNQNIFLAHAANAELSKTQADTLK